MNLQEFKAWFEGFTENMSGTPNEKQWKKIQKRVNEITPQATEIKYFYDHYWRPYYNYPWGVTYTTAGGLMQNSAVTNGYHQVLGENGINSCAGTLDGVAYTLTSNQAFTMLGKADAASL